MGDLKPKARERIVYAAAEYLTKQGYYATGLNDILKKSGAPKGSLYHYFPDGKEQLAVEALKYSTSLWFDDLTKVLEKSASPSEAIKEICRFLAQQLKKSNWQNGCPIATITLEAASTIDSIQETATQHWTRWHQHIKEFFKAHKFEIPDATVTSSIAAIEGALLLARAHKSEVPLLQVGEFLAQTFENLKVV